MFQNPIIEFLSRSNPIIISMLHILIISCVFIFGGIYYKIELYVQFFLFILGVFTWTLAEYLIHRYVFHWIGNNKVLKSSFYAANSRCFICIYLVCFLLFIFRRADLLFFSRFWVGIFDLFYDSLFCSSKTLFTGNNEEALDSSWKTSLWEFNRAIWCIKHLLGLHLSNAS